jgi:hypothetical protein
VKGILGENANNNETNKKQLFLSYLNISEKEKNEHLNNSDISSNCSNISNNDAEEILKLNKNPLLIKEKPNENNISATFYLNSNSEDKLLPSKKYQNDINYINSKQNFTLNQIEDNHLNENEIQDNINNKNNNNKKNKAETSNKNISLLIPDKDQLKKNQNKEINFNENLIRNLDINNNNNNINIKSNFSSNSTYDSHSHKNLLKDLTINTNNQIKFDDNNNNNNNDYNNIQYKEGYLYKITTSNKLKKLFFKLIGKDFYYYKNKTDLMHKGMHNIAGVFIKEEQNIKFENKELYCFSIIYPYRIRKYYLDNKLEQKKWIKDLREIVGYENLDEEYELKNDLGKGKFGLVKLAIHKKTNRKVAIKLIGKKDIEYSDLEMIKNEIEILKVCQHPNILKLYDVFENSSYIYLITEYLEGGDLFTYLQRRDFILPEKRASQLVHQICIAVYYLHSYGIIHRDLKPENMVMTSDKEDAEVKILDFGLSKILGPNELSNDPYGTIVI